MKVKVLYVIPATIMLSCGNSLPPIIIPPLAKDVPVNPVEVFVPLEDYDLAHKEAKEKKKPLLLFFSGWACANARKMEEYVLTDSTVIETISNNFVAYKAYVDDKRDLAKEKYYISKSTGKEITTIGGMFMELEKEVFKNEYQPFFVIVDSTGESVANCNYMKDKGEFLEFLKSGTPKE